MLIEGILLTIHAVVLDFAKAFDKAPVCGSILMWIHYFLCDRKQRVVVNGCKSDELSVTSGVPQGSVLGPTLFLIIYCINALPRQVDCCIRLFADDTLMY